jgi:hypothetical protein
MPYSREIGRDNTVAALRTERGLVLIVVVLLGLSHRLYSQLIIATRSRHRISATRARIK